MSGFEKLKEVLPSKEKFYSSLSSRNIIGKEYEHVLNIRSKFEKQKIKDYHNLYLKYEFLLLADVFEKFRNNNLKKCGLCSSQYLRAPALSWNVVLKNDKIDIELIQDSDMYIFFEKGTRGEISYISNRSSKANNKYLKSYDSKQYLKHYILRHE